MGITMLWHEGRYEDTQLWFILLGVAPHGDGERLYLYYLWNSKLLSAIQTPHLYSQLFASFFLSSLGVFTVSTDLNKIHPLFQLKGNWVIWENPSAVLPSKSKMMLQWALTVWVGCKIKIKRAWIPEGLTQLNGRQPVQDIGLNPGKKHFLLSFLSCICFKIIHKLVFQSICCINDRGDGSPSTEAPIHHSWQVLIFLITLRSRWVWVYSCVLFQRTQIQL